MENGKDKHERPIEYVEIDLDRPRRLLLNHNACAMSERTLARLNGEWNPLPKILARVRLGGITETMVLLWAGLRHDDSELTIEQAGDFLDSVHLDYVVGKLSESVEKHFPSKEQKQRQGASEDPASDPTNDETPRTGSNSGPSGASI